MVGYAIEARRGPAGLDPVRRAQVLAFWERHGVLGGEAATARLDEVVCVLVDPDGEVAGVSSAYPDRVELVGGRRFLLYRRFLAHGVPDEAEEAVLVATFDALNAEFVAGGDRDAQWEAGAPVGLCALVRDRAVLEAHPEALWPVSQLLYAGWAADGAQVRIRYFDLARIA